MRTSFAPSPLTRVLAIAMLVDQIVVHVHLAPDHLEEVPYIGVGFVVASALLTAVAVVLVLRPRNRWAWLGGAALMLGMALLFTASRLVGLPDYHEAWTSDGALGLWSLPAELIYLLCAADAMKRTRYVTRQPGPVGMPATV